MNFKKQGKASFFKILLRDSIDRLPLPLAFAKKYLENSNIKKQKVILKTKSGFKWSVKYSKIKDKYYFMDGWLKFMKDNGLHVGMFLVFWSLASRSSTRVFQVYVYEPNGCLKEPAASNACASNRKRKIPVVKLEEGDDDSSKNMHKIMTRVLRKSNYSVMPMLSSFVKATGISGYSSVRLRNDKGRTWGVKLFTYTYGTYQVTKMGARWGDFTKDNKIKVGNICEFYHVKSNLLCVRVLRAEEGYMV
ncbi:putative B3 domain-containing protein REM15 [Bidens hawaiensis]|uniref:putative B3 domain-containing protein REM15 n=1 Tax=Bidens hawaiensis TaxID=980011 RepID=UPI00404B16B5